MISTKIRENIFSAQEYKEAKSIYSYLNCLHKLLNPLLVSGTQKLGELYCSLFHLVPSSLTPN